MERARYKKVYEQIQNYDNETNIKEDSHRNIKNSHYKTEIFYINEQNLNSIIETINQKERKQVVRSYCLPLDALDYYWMADFIEAVLDTVHQNILQKVPPW